MLQIEKEKKWVSPTKRVLDSKMNYDTKLYSQNCPHDKMFDRSLAKKNFSYNSKVWKILFQRNLMVTVAVWNKYLDLEIFLSLLRIFFTSQNYIIITLVNTMQ